MASTMHYQIPCNKYLVDRNCLLCIIKCDAEAIVLIRGGVGYQTETRGQLTLMVAPYTEV